MKNMKAETVIRIIVLFLLGMLLGILHEKVISNTDKLYSITFFCDDNVRIWISDLTQEETIGYARYYRSTEGECVLTNKIEQ